MLAALTACGGGGGDGGSTNTSTYNLDAAVSRALQNGMSQTGLTGSFGGVTFTASWSYTPQADQVFDGTLRRVARETVTIAGGGTSQTSVASQFFTTGPFTAVGTLEDDGTLTVFTSTGSLPTAARVGDSGAFNTGISYANAARTIVTATARTTWSLDADSDTTALACLRSVVTETGSATPLTGAQCFRINTAGDVLGAVVTVQQGDINLTLR